MLLVARAVNGWTWAQLNLHFRDLKFHLALNRAGGGRKAWPDDKTSAYLFQSELITATLEIASGTPQRGVWATANAWPRCLLVRRGIAGRLQQGLDASWHRLPPRLISIQCTTDELEKPSKTSSTKTVKEPRIKLLWKKQERVPMTGMSCDSLPHLVKHKASAGHVASLASYFLALRG